MPATNRVKKDQKVMMKFLEAHTDAILEKWMIQTGLKSSDPFYHEIISNVQNSLRIMKIYIRRPNRSMIKRITLKISTERIEARADLSLFVQNINIGKQIIFDLIAVSELDEERKYYGMIQINQFIDTYLYYAITYYTSMQNEIINNKSAFIQEMHKDRLSILGQISASFAHEFRNPLTSIKGFIRLLERDLMLDEQSKYYFNIINKEMVGLENKVSQFLYLSKVQNLGEEPEEVDLVHLLKEMIQFMYPRFVTEDIEVETDFQTDLKVYGVMEQIKQVILNILNNAVEELSDGVFRRRVVIKAHEEDQMAVVTLMNNGKKIPSYVLDNIFEPFISTKKLGTGLGLAVCKKIIEKHNGNIDATSEENNTTFSFKLPLYNSSQE